MASRKADGFSVHSMTTSSSEVFPGRLLLGVHAGHH
jgi:hypothetical protein